MQEKKICLRSNLPSRPVEARKQCNDIFKMFKNKTKQPVNQKFSIQQNCPSKMKAKDIFRSATNWEKIFPNNISDKRYLQSYLQNI